MRQEKGLIYSNNILRNHNICDIMYDILYCHFGDTCMNDYLTTNEILSIAKNRFDYTFKQVPEKTDIFQGRSKEWNTATLFTHKAKTYSKNFYTVILKQEDARILDMTDESILMLRFEERTLVTLNWKVLKKYLTSVCLKSNDNKRWWELNIHTKHLEIDGIDIKIPIEYEYF